MLTRAAILCSLAITLDAVGLDWLGSLLIIVLALVIDYQARIEGQQQGVMQGIANYISMTEEQQQRIRTQVRKWQQL